MPWSITQRKEWQFFTVLPKADRALAAAWWAALILRGILPAVFAIAMGALVGAVQNGGGLAAPLAAMAVTFMLLQVLPPIHTAIGGNLGDRTAAWLYDRLTEACVRPPGVAHLEDPELTSDLTAARDFDLGMASLIVVLQGARVAEVGSHDELMARGRHYAELYGIQAAAYR